MIRAHHRPHEPPFLVRNELVVLFVARASRQPKHGERTHEILRHLLVYLLQFPVEAAHIEKVLVVAALELLCVAAVERSGLQRVDNVAVASADGDCWNGEQAQGGRGRQHGRRSDPDARPLIRGAPPLSDDVNRR